MDVAQDPDALFENFKRMEISPGMIDGIVLTHCHFDHTRGVATVLGKIGKKDIPVIAHHDIFRLNFINDPFLRHVGVMAGDTLSDIQSHGGAPYLTKDVLQIMPGIVTTGEVERLTDFEEPGIDLFTIENGRVVNDRMLDDISLVADVGNKGLVIVTGCSHAGIINIIRHAQKITGTQKIHGIMGGFHLVEATGERIQKTVSALEEFNPDWIYAGHCTGFKAQTELVGTFKEKFLPLQTGMIVDIC
jgi:7,8-dihydropterin-6-yl-methyl-4-(beta-D-ribofuranosyl)aminobenzene 5'-phosphate synthase